MPGIDGYLHVQLFVGFTYIAAFIACRCPCGCPVGVEIVVSSLMRYLTGWILRAWKIHQLDMAKLQRDRQHQDEDPGRNSQLLSANTDGSEVPSVTSEISFATFLRKGSWIFAIRRV